LEENIFFTVKETISSFAWQDELVVYGQLSGDTHLLDITSGELINYLSERLVSRENICKKLAGIFPDADPQEVESYLDNFIARFTALGLLSKIKQSE
jgi:PqqD family protein of HPr-rel-A system